MTNLEKLMLQANTKQKRVYISVNLEYDSTINELVPYFNVQFPKDNAFVNILSQECFEAKSLTLEEAAAEVIKLILKDLEYRNKLLIDELKQIKKKFNTEETPNV